ncbi:L-threonylcarbamoyladenylate synthase [Microlunatus elymi]|uniref:L-threonylcarbamoyladenylate synthase n=1 Tax=Microlunatus elymi TaxID=2596828 RepID=UPI001AEFDF42|nr:L-threonylcarbamoyladenylate synthase [Microlunatus elymi]
MSSLDEQIAKAANILRNGGLVALPTETVYGLGANAEDPVAVRRVFEVKRRPPTHPLIIHLGNPDQLSGWADRIPGAAHVLAESFWAGPLTLVLRRSVRVPDETIGGGPTVALRVPDHPVTLAVLNDFGGGIAAPSANPFKGVSPTSADHVRAGLGDAVDFVLDGGPCTVGVESTIVQLVDDAPTILRPGGVTKEDLEAVLGSKIDVESDSAIRVPGQHPSHYAPHARVRLARPEHLINEAETAHACGRRVGVLVPPPLHDVPITASVVVLVPASTTEYARQLYGLLRRLDEQGCELIVASLPEPDGLGLAIANRLSRAAGPR